MARIMVNDDDGGVEEKASAEQESEAPAGEESQQLRRERDELFERLARATADFKNSVKRMETDMESRLVYANSSLIKSLLPVIDNFERALAVDVSKTDQATILKRMQIGHDQWVKVLKQQ